jgi:hypothetical protein
MRRRLKPFIQNIISTDVAYEANIWYRVQQELIDKLYRPVADELEKILIPVTVKNLELNVDSSMVNYGISRFLYKGALYGPWICPPLHTQSIKAWYTGGTEEELSVYPLHSTLVPEFLKIKDELDNLLNEIQKIDRALSIIFSTVLTYPELKEVLGLAYQEVSDRFYSVEQPTSTPTTRHLKIQLAEELDLLHARILENMIST